MLLLHITFVHCTFHVIFLIDISRTYYMGYKVHTCVDWLKPKMFGTPQLLVFDIIYYLATVLLNV